MARLRWDTAGKSGVVTPHLWNDYLRIADDVKLVLLRTSAGEYPLNELVNADKMPELMENRWELYPHTAPTSPLSELDRRKVQQMDNFRERLVSLVEELRQLIQGIPVKDSLGRRRFTQRPWLKEPYASHCFAFNSKSREYRAKAEQIMLLSLKIKEVLVEVGNFFYDDFGFFRD